MPEITIRLRVNPQTGKKDILVDLRSDSDALPHEHEQQHRQLVDKLIEGGLVSADEIGNITIQRDDAAATETRQERDLAQQTTPQRRAEQEGQSP